MKLFLIVSLVAVLPTISVPAATNQPPQTNAAVSVAGTNDLVEQEFKRLEDMDDEIHAEIDKWIRDNEAFAAQGAGTSSAQLNERIRAKREVVRKAYENFIARNPSHAGARLAFGSFLHDSGEEEEGEAQTEKARQLDPKNPAAWNNLANHYGHTGAIKKAFEYYAKAIELNPSESVYYQNFATTVYLFRKDAVEFYKISEQQVFDKALDLYDKAFKHDPKNFNLATDLAQTYYAIRPLRIEEALKAWTNALAIAHDDVEREGVHIHLARFKWQAGRTNEARAHLNLVTNTMYADLKKRLARHLDGEATSSKETNAPPAAAEKKPE